ncbi:dihydrofolate reductase [Spizellomyces punctatus DAOM BR117]|uniref:Dihydrofolate reductase n=1 Tax=Spizellomyces punctatus (strain DAOM BR117) TaxID=645134 RepID=A0A0L0H4N5_SPIPD|nr:dihydrofolate reductase [Spizellomyces punctatus DAOM BR117]KNC95876.1 hypothetical protein SPPG_08740 [Spizellomyces punctatus DAOM BR117]|eukprot:XP_016603916.1 hypothetical protein SPPG_08740 [Spizellomyces punctatus DAOM BR117]
MASKPSLTLIVAALANGGIGVNGSLPWRLPGDMRFFQQVTTFLGRRPDSAFPDDDEPLHDESDKNYRPMNVTIMGRKTWESIPPKFRPLKGRINIVLSSREDVRKDVISQSTPEAPTYAFSALDAALSNVGTIAHTNIFIIGGAQLYATALSHPLCQRIFLTSVQSPTAIECDAFFPSIPKDKFQIASPGELRRIAGSKCPSGTQSEKGFTYEFQLWTRISPSLAKGE